MSTVPPRYIGPQEPHAEFFWKSGADGMLRIARCDPCQRFHHPPYPVCPFCHGRQIVPTPVSGRGTVAAYTVNHQPFMPGFDPPYVFAFVEIDEDPTIRIATNVVDCPIEAVHIGMAVTVRFEENGEFFVPLFGPASP